MRPSILHIVPATSPNPLLMGTTDYVDADFAVGAFGTDTPGLKQACANRGIPFFGLGEAGSLVHMARSLRRTIRSLRPDVVEAHTLRPSFASALLATASRTRPGYLAVRHHNLNHYLHGSRAGRWGDRFVNARVDGVIAVSYAVRETCIAEGLQPDRCFLAHNGLNLERFMDRRPVDLSFVRRAEHMLLAVGRLDWQKDYPTMLKCLSELVKRGVDVELAVLGEGSKENTELLTELCSELDISNRVRWLGWQSDVAAWMHTADILVHSAADEAHPLVLIEVLASGLPVVATAAGGSREVVQPFYELVPIGDYDALANAVQDVLEDLPAKRSYAENIRSQAAAYFDPRDMAEAHLAACKVVLRRRAGTE